MVIKNKAYETVSDGSLSKQPANHVHLWMAGSVTEQIDHKAKTKEVQIPVNEWDEEVWSKDKKHVCLNCVWNKKPKQGESWVDIDGDGKWTAQEEGQIYFKDCCYDSASDLAAHMEKQHMDSQQLSKSSFIPSIIQPQMNQSMKLRPL